MASNESERLLNRIGQLTFEKLGHSDARILLYAQLDVNMVGVSIFIEHDNYVEYLDPSDDICSRFLELWEENEPRKRWVEIQYMLRGDKFTADFIYPGDFDPDEHFFERRVRVVARHFGDKPIVYPPWDVDAESGSTFDL